MIKIERRLRRMQFIWRMHAFNTTLVLFLTSLIMFGEAKRDKKLFSLFEVIRFQNDVCNGTSDGSMGTCYTQDECQEKNGKNDGTCASGFGVCCVFNLSCGQSSQENNTNLIQDSSSSQIIAPNSNCNYKLCKSSKDICRIRFDFSTLILNPPVGVGTIPPVLPLGGVSNVGQCLTDRFSISNPGGKGSPIICGTNSGYHMILDASTDCHQVSIQVGGTQNVQRSWNIQVKQYSCGQDDIAGPLGCLQYYTATTASIQSFAWPTGTGPVGAGTNHLANQDYEICIRRNVGICNICFIPTTIPGGMASAAAQASFGLSSGMNAMIQIGSQCTQDYLNIIGGTTATIAAMMNPMGLLSLPYITRICGRVFSVPGMAMTPIQSSICTAQAPFRVGVHFDETENCAATAAANCELIGAPGGITGFQLTYVQNNCNMAAVG